ncbi:unnamed protein product, partial [Hapterophycus canaliculatus]
LLFASLPPFLYPPPSPQRNDTGVAPLFIIDNMTLAHASIKPDLSYLPTFNVAGGRPNERFGTRGSFTRGVRIMSGGPPRDMPFEAATGPTSPGKVLSVSSVHKPDLSGELRANVVGGRPNERLGARGSFTPGVRRWAGGEPREVPVERETVDHGKVLFVSSGHKSDTTYSALTNIAGGRPTERLGARGSFTPGVRHWAGGEPRDIPLPRVRDPGTVIFVSSSEGLRPSTSYAGETNVSGGREYERRGRLGSFEHGVVEVAGGPLRMPSNSERERELWHEGGQKENRYRRCGPGHFVAGVSILSGGMPIY